jgi:hypothetical protein
MLEGIKLPKEKRKSLNFAQDKPNTVVQTRHHRKQHQEKVAYDTECLSFRSGCTRSVNQKQPEGDGKLIIAGQSN